MYNLPDGGGSEYIKHDWARDIYKGLFCLAKGHLPQESIASKLQNE